MATTDLTRTYSLLPSENPESLHPGDIRHWIAVYSELLRTIPELAPGDSGGRLLKDHLDGMQQRLDYWKQRSQLGAHSTSESASLRAVGLLR